MGEVAEESGPSPFPRKIRDRDVPSRRGLLEKRLWKTLEFIFQICQISKGLQTHTPRPLFTLLSLSIPFYLPFPNPSPRVQSFGVVIATTHLEFRMGRFLVL